MSRAILFVILCLPAIALAASWKPSTRKDSLTDAKVLMHEAVSDNAFSFAFPYGGSTRARLLIRQNGEEQKDVIFSIERGQLMHDVRDGEIRIRFDDSETETFYTSQSASHDSHIAFIGDAQRFIDRANNANRVRIEFTAFRNGTHVADFRFSKRLPLLASAGGRKPAANGPTSSGTPKIIGRAERLEAREDECRTKGEFVECLEMVRTCYQKVQSIEDEADCQERVERFPR